MRYYVAFKMSSPFDAKPNVANYIPGLQSSATWLQDQFQKPGTMQQNIPGLLPVATGMQNLFQQPPNLQQNIPGLMPAAGALRNIFGGKDPATAKPPKSNRYRDRERTGVTRMGGVTYDLSIPHHRELYDAAIKKNQDSMGNPKSHDLRGGSGLKPDGSGQFDPPPNPSPYVDQQGRDSGKLSGAGFAEANDRLARLGITTTRYGDFQSNDLPGVDNTGTKKGISNDDFILQAQSGGYLDGFKGGSNDDAILYAQGKGFQPVEQKQTEGSPKLTKSGVSEVTQTVNTQPLGSQARYGAEFMADRPGMPADKNESLVGLRAAEASKGLLYASGKYWKANPNAGQEGQKDFVEINKAEWKSIKRGDQHATQYKPPAADISDTDTSSDTWTQSAQDFKNDYVGLVQQTMKDPGSGKGYTTTEEEKPVSRIDSTASVKPAHIRTAPTLTQAVDVRFTDKDRTGRYNNFNNR